MSGQPTSVAASRACSAWIRAGCASCSRRKQFVALSAAYFVMNHVFYGSGVVSIIIELVGGTLFLIVILKKGRL